MYSYDRTPSRTAAKENPLKPLEKELRGTAAKVVGKGMKLADGSVDSSSTSTMASFGIARSEMEKAIQKAIPAKLQKLVTDVEVKIEAQNAMLVVRFYSDEDLEDEAEALMGAVGKGVTFPFNGGESGASTVGWSAPLSWMRRVLLRASSRPFHRKRKLWWIRSRCRGRTRSS